MNDTKATWLDEATVRTCGVDMEPTEPGRYVCDEPASSRFPHHTCGQHHDPAKISCDDMADFAAVDDDDAPVGELMTSLRHFLLRVKAKRQTLYLMRRYRVWYIDNPRAATVDRWWRA